RPVRGRWRCAGTFPYCGVPGQPVRSRCLSQSQEPVRAPQCVSAIVLEVPTPMIGKGRVRSWATASLLGHAPEVQVSRWGLPLITHVFMPDEDMHEAYNRATPAADLAQ